MNDPLYLSQNSLNGCLLELLLSARHIEENLKLVMQEFNLSLKHYRILLCLTDAQPMSHKNLQKKLSIHKQSLHDAMAELMKQGYLTSYPDRRDKRIKLLTISEKGEQLWKEIFKQCQSVQSIQSVFQHAKQHQVQNYRIIAQQLYDSLHANAIK